MSQVENMAQVRQKASKLGQVTGVTIHLEMSPQVLQKKKKVKVIK